MMAKVVCITGVAGGIGAATAEIFAQADWDVVGVDCRHNSSRTDSIGRFIRADLINPKNIEKIFEEIAEREGRLDVLVNNAAIQIVKPLVDLDSEEWDMLMAVNVRAAYLAIKYAFPLLRRQGGSVINVSSVHAIATSKSMAAYAASKGALAALTRAAAIELAEDKIRVNAVLPGAVDTAMLKASLSRESQMGKDTNNLKRSLGLKHALGRIGRPEEIAETIMFLADNRRSSFITGQCFIVDGGATARLSTE
jgi:NAD(P)-dependent dehydrogenase (short-subunit alcohol dehydrogenase family)